jgi:hypothetical protein
MTVTLLVLRRQGAVTLCQFRWSCESVPKNVQWHQRLDISTSRYALKPSSPSSKDSSALTFAKEPLSPSIFSTSGTINALCTQVHLTQLTDTTA